MAQYSADRNAVFAVPDWDVSWSVDLSRDCPSNPALCIETGTPFVPAEINGDLSIAGTTLYVESYDRRLYALDALTGRVTWSSPMTNIAMNAPLISNGAVIVGTGGGLGYAYAPDSHGTQVLRRSQGDDVMAFDTATGHLLWTFHTAGENMPTGVVTDADGPKVVFTSGDELAYVLDVTGGTRASAVGTPGSGIMSSLALSDGIIYGSSGYGWGSPILYKAFATHDSVLAAHAGWTWAMSGGKLLWTSPYGNGHGSPVVGDGTVFVESTVVGSWTNISIWRTEVDALDAVTGRLRWRYVTAPGTAHSPGSNNDAIGGVYEAGVLYQTLPYARAFAAFDGASGRIVWAIPTHGIVKMSGVVAAGKLYFGDSEGYLYVVDAASGAVEQQVKFPSLFACSSPVIVGQTMFVANGSTLYALRLTDLNRGILSSAATP
ncbi:MAG TPA: PQQ-binding-like beta-propeller repeat protein [Candidatus Tyrphobacter sp.]